MPFRLERKEVDVKGVRREFVYLPHPGAVVVVARRAGRIVLLRQLRPAVDERLWELPAGTLQPGEDPGVCARRELAEETGLRAAELIPLGSFYPAPGYSAERLYVYLAGDLTEGRQNLDEGEDIDDIAWFTTEEVREMVRLGTVRDAKTIAGLFYLELHGHR